MQATPSIHFFPHFILMAMGILAAIVIAACILGLVLILRKNKGRAQQEPAHEPSQPFPIKDILSTLNSVSSDQIAPDEASRTILTQLGSTSGIDDVVKMVGDKKISPEEGLKLISALAEGKRRAQEQLSAPGTGAGLLPPGTSVKKIRRSGTSRIISGVCGGFAKYFDKDPLLVRLALVALTLLTGGAAVLFYVICWIAIPLGDDSGG